MKFFWSSDLLSGNSDIYCQGLFVTKHIFGLHLGWDIHIWH